MQIQSLAMTSAVIIHNYSLFLSRPYFISLPDMANPPMLTPMLSRVSAAALL